MKLFNIFLFVAVAVGTASADIFSTQQNDTSKTIREKIRDERRFVLFNSRRLTGECLSVCVTESPTASPTASPTVAGRPLPPLSTVGTPIEGPTLAPTREIPTSGSGKSGSGKSGSGKSGSGKSGSGKSGKSESGKSGSGKSGSGKSESGKSGSAAANPAP